MFWICLRTKANLIHRVGFKMFRKYCIAICEETTLTSKPACNETFFCSYIGYYYSKELQKDKEMMQKDEEMIQKDKEKMGNVKQEKDEL